MSQDYFAPGQWNFICDRCGRAFKSSQGRKTWNKLYVCPRCWEVRHPQDFVKGHEEQPVPPWIRPRRDTTVGAPPRRIPALFTPPATPKYLAYGTGGSGVGAYLDASPVPPLLLPPGDPFRTQRLLLMHFDGANASTTFTDSSTYALAVNREDAVFQISTAQSKFGGSSLFGGDDDRLTLSMNANWTGRDWNVKCFVWPISSIYQRFGVFYFGPNLIGRIDGLAADGSYKFRLILSGATALESTLPIPDQTWSHLCVSCQSINATDSQIRLFVDGNLNAQATSSDGNLGLPGTGTFSIGRFDLAGFRSVAGYVDEYVVTAAVEHTASFTPQSTATPDF